MKLKPSCVECGLPHDDPEFTNQGPDFDHYPTYWSDAGLLCGAACSTKHYVRRMADGTYTPVPSQPHVNIYDV